MEKRYLEKDPEHPGSIGIATAESLEDARNREDTVAAVGSARAILETYLKRWKIDSSYRDAKQELGSESYELRKLRGIRRHWLMVFLAHDLLQLSPRKGEPIRWMKVGLATVGSRCRYAAREVLRSFIELVVELARKIRTPDEILKLTISDLKGLKTLYRMEIT